MTAELSTHRQLQIETNAVYLMDSSTEYNNLMSWLEQEISKELGDT